MLWLALTIYSPPGRAPNELADRYRFGSPEAVEHYLLAEFVRALYPDGKDLPRWQLWRRPVTLKQADRWLGFLASDSPIHRRPLSPRRRKRLNTFETRDIQNVAWWRFTEAAGGLRILSVGARVALLMAVLWQLVLRTLRDSGNWHDGAYVGHLPFRHVLLDGPLGQAVWPTIHHLLHFVPTRTRDHAYLALNSALRHGLSLISHHLPVVIIITSLTVGIFTFNSSEASRPRRVHIRPTVLMRWLSDTLQGALMIAFLMWVVIIYWNNGHAVGVFFSSRATWLTALILSLLLGVYRWPIRLVAAIDVVGSMEPLQSLRADNLASVFVTISKRALFTVTVALEAYSRHPVEVQPNNG
jgi:hypothetical protein